MLTIASLSAIALTVPIAYAQTTSTKQENQQVPRGEGHGRGEGQGWGDRGGREFGGERGGGLQGGMFRGITLTDDQKAKMKQINQSFRESTQSLHQALGA